MLCLPWWFRTIQMSCFVFAVATSACVPRFDYDEEGIPEHTTLDYVAMGEEGERRAADYIGSAYSDIPRLPPTHPLAVRAQGILERLLAVSEPDSATIGGYFQFREWAHSTMGSMTLDILKMPFNDSEFDFSNHPLASFGDPKYCKPSFEYYNADRVGLAIVGDGRPYARAFPNNTIFLHRGLVDQDSVYAAANDDELAGVLAHELAHLRDGHIFWQWALARGRTATAVRTILSAITLLLPVRYGYAPGRLYTEVSGFERSIEFDADIAAVELMAAAGHDPSAYIGLLDRLEQFAAENPEQVAEPLDQIHHRVRCAELLLKAVAHEGSEHSSDEDHFTPYTLCRAASVHLDPDAAERVVTWSYDPGAAPLEELIESLDPVSRERLDAVLDPRAQMAAAQDLFAEGMFKCN